MKTEVKAVKSTQTAMPEIGREEKTQYFISIGEGETKLVMNVGLKSYEHIKKMEEKEEEQKQGKPTLK